jgi:hypothetical protein
VAAHCASDRERRGQCAGRARRHLRLALAVTVPATGHAGATVTSESPGEVLSVATTALTLAALADTGMTCPRWRGCLISDQLSQRDLDLARLSHTLRVFSLQVAMKASIDVC